MWVQRSWLQTYHFNNHTGTQASNMQGKADSRGNDINCLSTTFSQMMPLLNSIFSFPVMHFCSYWGFSISYAEIFKCNGHSADSQTMLRECQGFSIDEPFEAWGHGAHLRVFDIFQGHIQLSLRGLCARDWYLKLYYIPASTSLCLKGKLFSFTPWAHPFKCFDYPRHLWNELTLYLQTACAKIFCEF